MDSDRPLKGADRIAAYLKTLPDAPGVYRMLNAAGDVLYVGKAKSLKKRVSSYARGAVHSERISRMIAETAEMLFVTTASEIEALLLESNLIKQLKPRYNVSYRDDKSFPNILLRQDHPFPQLLKHRGARTAKGVYFGPFANAGRGDAHLEHIATRLSAALLFGFGVRGPHQALPAVPDQALQRPLCRAAGRDRLWRAGARGGGFPAWQEPRGAGRDGQGDDRQVRGAGFRSGGAAARPAEGDEPDPGQPGHQSRHL